MQIIQLLNFVYLALNTDAPCGRISFELVNSTFLRVTANEFSRFFKFKKPVLWPDGLVKVNRFGEVDIMLEKNESEIWKGDSAIEVSNEGLRPYILPDFYETKVLAKTTAGQIATILHLRKVKPVYVDLNPGRFLRVKQTLAGKERRLLYVPVPYLPLRNLSYPNPKPGDWAYTDRPVNLMVYNRKSRLNQWLINRRVDDKVIIGNPFGTFKPTLLSGSRVVHLVATGFGMAPLISIALWILQTTKKTKVYLGVFNEFNEQLFWKRELTSISLADKRFQFQFLKPENNVTKKEENKKWVQSNHKISSIFPPIDDVDKFKHVFYVISGTEGLYSMMRKYLKVTYNRYFKRYYMYNEMPRILRTPTKYDSPNMDSIDYPDYSYDDYVPPGYFQRDVDAPNYKDTYYSREQNVTKIKN